MVPKDVVYVTRHILDYRMDGHIIHSAIYLLALILVKTLIEKNKMNKKDPLDIPKLNVVRINISGYGGEFVLGTITKEQYDYWNSQPNDKLEDYALDSFDHVNENKIPLYTAFLGGEGWHDCDNVSHNYGCDLESAWIDITLPDDTILTYENAYGLRDKYENMPRNHLQYSPYDEMIREVGQCYTSNETSYPQSEGHYFTAYSSEKGEFIYTEFELPDTHTFNPSRLVFHTTDLDGSEFLESISYIYPDDSSNDPTELDNEGGSTRGNAWECSIFHVPNSTENN